MCRCRPAAAVLLAVCALAASASAADWHRVAYDDAGQPGRQPHLLAGADWRYPEDAVPLTVCAADDPARTVAFGDRVLLAYKGLAAGARYRVRLTFLSDGAREQQILIEDQPAGGRFALARGLAVERVVDVPPAVVSNGTLRVAVQHLDGPNAVVSAVEVLSTDPAPLARGDRGLAVSAADRAEAARLVRQRRPRYTPIPVAEATGAPAPLSLDGTWQFHPNPPTGFEALAEPAAGWKPIEVPGEWVMQGFEVPKNVGAGYWRAFDVPAAWAGRRLKLRFDAVFSECAVWVNGVRAGGHLGGFTPFELDITALAKPGRNTLALRVNSDSIADVLASASKYAAHPLGGIARKVTLFAVPPVHIQSLHVMAELDDACRRGTAIVQLEGANEGTAAADGLEYRIAIARAGPGAAGGTVATAKGRVPALQPGNRFEDAVRLDVGACELWHCEHPNLYVARVEWRVGGRVVQTVARRFGFRRIEIRGNQLFVNNLPVKLRGVNRHEVHPLRGRSVPPGQWRRDVALFRDGNVNHIRTCHYPPSEELMEAADELGMFVEAEAPFCWARGGDDAFEPVVRQTLELVERDRSHPCVLFWSLGNESGWNRNFAMSSLAARALDPTRPQTFNFLPWGGAREKPDEGYCEIASDHYPGPGGPAKYAAYHRPVSYGEYCHLNAYNRHELATDPGVRDAWGKGTAAMYDAMFASQGTLGGSLWAGIDDTFFLPDGRVVGYGTWGPIDGWRRPKPEYWHMKNAYAPVRVGSGALNPGGHRPAIAITNRFDATPLDAVKFEWALVDRAPAAGAAGLGLKEGRLPAIAPHASGRVELPFKPADAAGKQLYLRFTSPRGVVVQECCLAVGAAGRVPPARDAAPGQVALREDGDTIGISGGGVAWTIAKATGGVQARVGDQPVLLDGPQLMLLPLNGAGGTQMTGADRYDAFTDTCRNWKVAAVTADAATATVRVTGTCDEAEGEYTLRVAGRDAVIEYAFTLRQAVNPRQWGLVFDLPRGFETLSWERRAQWPVYPADHIGRPQGRVQATVGVPLAQTAGPATAPTWPWAHDTNELGCNDFRSTKAHILRAALAAVGGGLGLEVVSDGTQHARAWLAGDRVRLLVADYSSAGAERFFRSHAAPDDRPLKQGDAVRGTVRLRVSGP